MKLQHDELKPLTRTFTDSLSELGNLKVVIYLLVGSVTNIWLPREIDNLFSYLQLEHIPQDYNGSALTLIESLSRYIS